MDIGAKFTFSGEIPSRGEILEKVRELSGLNGLAFSSADDEFWYITHRDFTARRFYVYVADNAINFAWGWRERWYLFDVTVGALISLGGHCDELLPQASYAKWVDVKDNYPQIGPVKFD